LRPSAIKVNQSFQEINNRITKQLSIKKEKNIVPTADEIILVGVHPIPNFWSRINESLFGSSSWNSPYVEPRCHASIYPEMFLFYFQV
jgi:hypothetical protein